MQVDGTGVRVLMETAVVDAYTPRYSPAGQRLAYSAGTGSDSMGTFDLWMVRGDGTGARLISALPTGMRGGRSTAAGRRRGWGLRFLRRKALLFLVHRARLHPESRLAAPRWPAFLLPAAPHP